MVSNGVIFISDNLSFNSKTERGYRPGALKTLLSLRKKKAD
jgi:hypothetical protein